MSEQKQNVMGGAYFMGGTWVAARAAHQAKHGEVVAIIASGFLMPTTFSTTKQEMA